MGVHKPFDPGLHASNDKDAREAIKTHFAGFEDGTGMTPTVVDNPDRYGPDLIVTYPDGSTYFIEVEVKQHWRNTDEFPFEELNIPERKKKFADMGCEFWVLNRYINRAIIVQADSLTADRLVECPNKYVKEGELFFKVPRSECAITKLRTAAVLM